MAPPSTFASDGTFVLDGTLNHEKKKSDKLLFLMQWHQKLTEKLMVSKTV